MPTVTGHPWLTPDLMSKARAWSHDNPSAGRTTMQVALGVSQYQAEVLLKVIREAAAPGAKAESMETLRHQVSWLKAENEQLKRERSAGRLLADALSDAVGLLPAFKIPKASKVSDTTLDEESVILHISDVQLGQKVSAPHTGGLGEYGYDTFRQRWDRYRANVRRILRYTPNPVPRCYVALGGDIIEGSTIFPGQQRQLDLVTVRQVTEGYEHFTALLLDLLGLFQEVVVVSVPGNHGRIGMRPGENAPHDNFDWLLAYFLEDRFRRSDVADRIRFCNPETWWSIFEVEGHNFLLAHGEQFKAWMNIPFYGADRFKARTRELFHELTGTAVTFDYVLLGHHHDPAFFHHMFLNGSWPGGSEFSLHKLQVGGRPVQQMLGVHRTRGVSWHRWIHLADREDLPKPTVFR